MRRIVLILLTLILCNGLAGCGAAISENPAQTKTSGKSHKTAETESEHKEPVPDGLLRIALTDTVSTMDVQKTSSDYLIPLNIYERLFDIQIDGNGSSQLVNALAEDYSVSEDGLRYSFTLRDDAFFADGSRVLASDVAFTFTRMLTLKDSVQTDFADMIEGATALIEGRSNSLSGISIQDDTHITITLSQPFAGYLYMLATPSCSILSEAFVRKAGDSFGDSADDTMGSGPYMVTGFSDEKITMEKNPCYHCREWEYLSVTKAEILILAPALIDKTFREGRLDLLDANEINPDIVESVYLSGDWDERLVIWQRVDVQYLMLNLDAPPLDDIRIRKAIQMAIDRQGIIDRLYGGEGRLLDGIFPHGLIGYNEDNQGWLKYDPEEAKRLINEVGSPEELHIELAVDSSGDVRKLTMMGMIRRNLTDVGLDATIVVYDSDSMRYLRRGGMLMAYSGEWAADYNDPDNFIYTFFGNRSKTLSRSGNLDDEEIFRRIARARTLQDQDERLAEYASLENLLVRDMAVWVPLFSSEHMFVLGDRIESFTPFWAGWSSMYFRDVYFADSDS